MNEDFDSDYEEALKKKYDPRGCCGLSLLIDFVAIFLAIVVIASAYFARDAIAAWGIGDKGGFLLAMTCMFIVVGSIAALLID